MTTKQEAPFALPATIRMAMQPADIKEAVCNSRSQCAIALNIYRELDLEVGRVRVSTAGVSIAKDGYRYYYRVPKRACRLVVDFDAGRDVEPIIYKLRRTNRVKIGERVNPARAAQVNEARKLRTAALAAVGQKPRSYPKGRYGI